MAVVVREPVGGNGVNDVVDGVLGLALQLPAVQKLGEEVGMNISDGVKGVTEPLNKRSSKQGGKKK